MRKRLLSLLLLSLYGSMLFAQEPLALEPILSRNIIKLQITDNQTLSKV